MPKYLGGKPFSRSTKGRAHLYGNWQLGSGMHLFRKLERLSKKPSGRLTESVVAGTASNHLLENKLRIKQESRVVKSAEKTLGLMSQIPFAGSRRRAEKKRGYRKRTDPNGKRTSNSKELPLKSNSSSESPVRARKRPFTWKDQRIALIAGLSKFVIPSQVAPGFHAGETVLKIEVKWFPTGHGWSDYNASLAWRNVDRDTLIEASRRVAVLRDVVRKAMPLPRWTVQNQVNKTRFRPWHLPRKERGRAMRGANKLKNQKPRMPLKKLVMEFPMDLCCRCGKRVGWCDGAINPRDCAIYKSWERLRMRRVGQLPRKVTRVGLERPAAPASVPKVPEFLVDVDPETAAFLRERRARIRRIGPSLKGWLDELREMKVDRNMVPQSSIGQLKRTQEEYDRNRSLQIGTGKARR